MATLTPQLISAVTAASVSPFMLVELDFADGKARATSLPFDIQLDGQTYSGLGVLGSVSAITEGAEAKSYGASLVLSAIPLEFADYLASQRIQGRIAKVKVGFVDKRDRIIGEPAVVFVGRMDTNDFTVGKTCQASIACESLLIDWERPRVARFTDVDQKLRHPGDRGFEFVSSVVNKEILWGVA